jgi:hypothetical protein
MKKILLALMLTLTCTSVKAEWILVGENGNGDFTLYVDFTGRRRVNDRVKMWHLLDYKTIQVLDGDKLLSSKVQNEYDCKEEQMRVLAFTWFSENLGRGRVASYDSSPGKWEPIQPESFGWTLWEIACGKIQ